MKLQSRLRKVMAVAALAGTLATSTAVFASDYKGHWAEATITEWKDKGVITGYEDGSFKPKEEVTRAELAKMLTQVFGLTLTTGAPDYKDVAAGTWHEAAIDAVSVAGLMTGTEDGNFRPSEPATREEAAYAIATAYHVVGESKEKFKDHKEISEWAVEAVEALVANGYIHGYKEDNTFRPQGAITRVEALVMLDKITAELINEPGTYKGEKETVGNVIVNKHNVNLKDMVINGNLYLTQGVGEGNVTLDNVTVTGNIIVEGGGANSIHIKGNSNINNIIVTKLGSKPVRIALAGTAQIKGEITLHTAAIIEGTSAKIPAIVVNGAPTLEIKGKVEVAKVDIEQPTTLTLDKETTVKEVTVEQAATQTKVDGTGTINKMVVEANEVTISNKVAINKDNITVGGEVTTPPVIEKPASGGGGGGGGGGQVQQKHIKLGWFGTVGEKGLSEGVLSHNDNTITLDLTKATAEDLDTVIGAITLTTSVPSVIKGQELLKEEGFKFIDINLVSGDSATAGSDHAIADIIDGLQTLNPDTGAWEQTYHSDILMANGYLPEIGGQPGMTLGLLKTILTSEEAAFKSARETIAQAFKVTQQGNEWTIQPVLKASGSLDTPITVTVKY